MATQICPICKADSFTWYTNEEESPLIQWMCDKCDYRAYEEESTIRECSTCKKKTESLLVDNAKKYWWCSFCNKTTHID